VDPNSPTGFYHCGCHLDASDCYLGAAGTAPRSSPPVWTSRAHVTKARNSFQPVPPEVSVDAWVGEAVVEIVDDVFLRDVCDSCTNIEETTCVGPQELVMFLFTLSKIVTSTCTSDRPLEVVDEDLLEPLLGVDRVVAEALQPHERCRVQSHREVDDLGHVGAPCDFNGHGVAT
jgi:hypothetical protein